MTFKLTNNFNSNTYWRAVPYGSSDRRESTEDEQEGVIYMKLESASKEPCEKAVLHSFPDLLVARRPPPGRLILTSTPYIIGCVKLIDTIKSFKLPKHNVYDVGFECVCPVTKEYKILAFESNLVEEASIYHSVYNLVDQISREKSGRLSGFAKNADELSQTRAKYRKEENKLLLVDTFVINKDYDVFWGGNNVLYVNERLENAISEIGFSGIQMLHLEGFNVRTSTTS